MRVGDRLRRHVVLAGDVGERAMRLDVGDLVTGRGRDRLQRADLVGDQVFDLRDFRPGIGGGRNRAGRDSRDGRRR